MWFVKRWQCSKFYDLFYGFETPSQPLVEQLRKQLFAFFVQNQYAYTFTEYKENHVYNSIFV